MSDIIRLRWRFYGRVQGVGFRAFCKSTAQEHGVPGWVRNEPDGSVACEVEGAAQRLAALKEELRSAHPWARVDRVEEMALAVMQSPLQGFDIHA